MIKEVAVLPMNTFKPVPIDGLNVQIWGHGDTPALIFHGGPGSGLNPQHTAYFDADRHRVVLFDQRGTGLSGRAGRVTVNTTQHTLRDAEAIRMALGYEDWIVLGGSWGGALALAYASAHPDRVRALIVRSTHICRPSMDQWMLRDRAKRFEAGQRARGLFLDPLDETEQLHPAIAWFARMEDNDAQAREAARRVMALEDAFHGPQPGTVRLPAAVTQSDINRTRVYLWYWLNNFFLPATGPGDPNTIAVLPHRLIHGADDLICPIEPARAFAQAGKLQFEEIERLGHNGLAPQMIAAVRQAVEDLSG